MAWLPYGWLCGYGRACTALSSVESGSRQQTLSGHRKGHGGNDMWVTWVSGFQCTQAVGFGLVIVPARLSRRGRAVTPSRCCQGTLVPQAQALLLLNSGSILCPVRIPPAQTLCGARRQHIRSGPGVRVQVQEPRAVQHGLSSPCSTLSCAWPALASSHGSVGCWPPRVLARVGDTAVDMGGQTLRSPAADWLSVSWRGPAGPCARRRPLSKELSCCLPLWLSHLTV